MKARRVEGLDPAGPLAENLERIVRTRLDELYAFMPRASEDDEALHDMRIAAKRLRYILELAHPVFGAYAAEAVKAVKELQEILGDIHDADVQTPEVAQLLAELVAADVLAGAPAHRDHYAGLLALVVELQVRRLERFERFLALWEELESGEFRSRLVNATHERPRPAGTVEPDGRPRTRRRA